jgi:hypothetical protein
MEWWAFAVKGFWALWNIITVALAMLLKVAFYTEKCCFLETIH